MKYRERAHHLFICFTSFMTWILIGAGGLVTSTESGLSVPDWPLSYGTLFPPMVGGIRFEHTHRLIAGTVGLLMLATAIWTQFIESRAWVKRLAWGAFGLVFFQALLGGWTVLHLLPQAVSIAHASTAQLFFLTTIVLAHTTSTSARYGGTENSGPGTRNTYRAVMLISCVTLVFVYMQIILGAARRHHVLGIMPHIAGAGVVTLSVLLLFFFIRQKLREDRSLAHASIATLVILLGEFFLGLSSFALRVLETRENIEPSLITVWTTTAHVVIGAALLGTLTLLTLQCMEKFRTVCVTDRTATDRYQQQAS